MSNARDYRGQAGRVQASGDGGHIHISHQGIPSASAILHRARRKQRMGGGNRDKLISNRAPAHGRIGHAVAQDRSSKPPWHPAGMYARPTAVRRTEWHRE